MGGFLGLVNKNWYVVQTKPLREETTSKLLSQGGFEVFFPKIKIFSRTVRKSETGPLAERIKPLFPSYLFVYSNLHNFDELRTLRYTRGVNKIIGDNGRPISLREEVIETIRQRVGKEGYIEQGAFLKPGDKVIVQKGVLRDLIGIMEKPIDEKGRIEVLFKIVHHQMRAKVYCGDVEKF